MGGDVLDEDEHANKVKSMLAHLDKAQWLLLWSGGDKGEQGNLVQLYRTFLEQLLLMFEESMDENVLQTIIDKMDFNADGDLAKGLAKV